MKLFQHRKKSGSMPKSPIEKANDNPSKYEGKEHIKYKNPGFSKHDVSFPKDAPHMKSKLSKSEGHEMEDNYHMKTVDQTEDTLPAKIKRAMMKMDAKDQQDPKPLYGNMMEEVSKKGVEDSDSSPGDEDKESDNYMQKNSGGKESRKKLIVAVMQRKMKKG
jgi:hypothetical protein